MQTVDVELKHVVKEFPSVLGEPFRAVDDISLQIHDGEFFALLGPSGCGKTTTLRMIAGFEQVSSGDILIRGKSVRRTPPYRRPVNTVFQDYALFPHMSVLQNVMFGLKMENIARSKARAMAMEALELVQLPHLASRRPRQLSGGQQQRIALARALVKKPAVLLLDEPLGALDLKLRKAMQFELKAMQQQLGITFVYVTHDQEEAMTMADRIAVMHDGHLMQVGTPQDIYEKPHSRYVADFIGETNFVEGSYYGQRNQFGQIKVGENTILEGVVDHSQTPVGTKVTLAIRPEKLGVLAVDGQVSQTEGAPVPAEQFKLRLEAIPSMTVTKGRVIETFYIGTDTRYQIQIGDNIELACRSQNFGNKFETIIPAGKTVYVYWDNENARILSE